MRALTSPIHLAFIAMIALIILGPKRHRTSSKSLGTGIREFRDTLSMEHREDSTAITASAGAAPPLAPIERRLPIAA